MLLSINLLYSALLKAFLVGIALMSGVRVFQSFRALLVDLINPHLVLDFFVPMVSFVRLGMDIKNKRKCLQK